MELFNADDFSQIIDYHLSPFEAASIANKIFKERILDEVDFN